MAQVCPIYTVEQHSEFATEPHMFYSDPKQVEQFQALLNNPRRSLEPKQYGGGIYPAVLAKSGINLASISKMNSLVDKQPWQRIRLEKDWTWKYNSSKGKTFELVTKGKFPLTDQDIADWRTTFNSTGRNPQDLQAAREVFYSYFQYKVDKINKDIKGDADRGFLYTTLAKEYRDTLLKFGFDPDTIHEDIFKVNGLYENIYTQLRRSAVFLEAFTGVQPGSIHVDHIIPVVTNGLKSYKESESYDKVGEDLFNMITAPKHKGENLSLLVNFLNLSKSNKRWSNFKKQTITMFNNLFGGKYQPRDIGVDNMAAAVGAQTVFVNSLRNSLKTGRKMPSFGRGPMQFQGVEIPANTSLDTAINIMQKAYGVHPKIAEALKKSLLDLMYNRDTSKSRISL